MTASRGTAVAAALLTAALAAAGCGIGPGPRVGSVELSVTREYGRVRMLQRSLAARESDTVMRLLERSADVATRYGGGFVQSIGGIGGGERGGRPYDWFYYVDGVEAPVGAAGFGVRGGERVWWDYRDWGASDHVPAVVGSWPAPFADGYGGRRRPVAVGCEGGGAACGEVRAALAREGVQPAAGAPRGALRILVGPWRRLRTDQAAALVERGPAESGIFARFARRARGYDLIALDEGGREARDLGPGAGLVAATSLYGAPPTWLVTGGTPAAVRAAAAALDAKRLRDHYAVAIAGRKDTPLPVEGR